MMLKKLALTGIAVALTATPLFAVNPWKDCGIGAAIFDESDEKIFAVTSNLIWDLGSTATTSATSSDSTCNASVMETAKFIQIAYLNLEEDTTVGSGDHLDGILATAGCSAEKSVDLRTTLSSQFTESIQGADYAEKDQQLKREEYYQMLEGAIESHPEAECKILS